MKVRELKKRLKQGGWEYEYSRGDHHYFRHPSKPGKVTVPGNDGDGLNVKTLNTILKQAELER